MISNDSVKQKKVEIPMGGLEISYDGTILQTFVGSCVAVCIYDKSKKIGGMAHVMLPKNNSDKSTAGSKYEGKFADDAINTLIKKIKNIYFDYNLESKIVGGATTFDNNFNLSTFNIGKKNIATIKTILQEKKIPLVSMHLSLSNGCWVTFDSNLQKVFIKDKEGEKII